MQYKIEKCSKCEATKPIVNRKYILCNDCNYIRLNGENAREEKIKKAQELLRSKVTFASQTKPAIKEAKVKVKPKPIKQITTKQAAIEREYARTCQEIDQEREPVCESCGRGDRPLSHSHTISRKRCKEIGKPHLIFAKGNIVLECYEEPTSNPTACHNIWEVSSWEDKMSLDTYEQKIEYIKNNDPELYRKITNLWT